MQNQMGAQQAGSPSGSPTPGGVTFGRTPSTTVIVNLSREKLNRGGARPIFPSVSALPALQNMQRMQQQGMMSMGQQQPNLSQLQQAALLQQSAGLGQQASMGAMLPGMQGSLGGLQGLQGLQGMTGMQQSVPSLMGQATIGAPPGNMSIGVNLGLGVPQQQQQQYANLLAQQQAAASLLGGQRSTVLGGQQSNLLSQQSNLLAALQNQQQQSRIMPQQSSGQLLGMGQMGGASQLGMMNTLTGSVSSNPQMGLLSANLMSSSPQITQQKSQINFNALMPSSRASKPMLQAMETLQGGAPGVQGITGSPAIAGTPAPIVMSQPITRAGLAPQMQHLLLKGLPGYTSTLVLILVPQE